MYYMCNYYLKNKKGKEKESERENLNVGIKFLNI